MFKNRNKNNDSIYYFQLVFMKCEVFCYVFYIFVFKFKILNYIEMYSKRCYVEFFDYN